jgi:Zn-finger nucleic acid-binding protein
MKSQKDQLTEMVDFDERANEEKYFALKDHDRIEEMKTDFQKAQTAARQAQIVGCPKCPGSLASYKFMNFVLDRCESCHGFWLENSQLRGIVRKASRGPLGAFLDRCFSKDQSMTKN